MSAKATTPMKSATASASSTIKPFELKVALPFLAFRMSPNQIELILRLTILVLVYIMAFAIRLFSVLRYEMVIHEFDPYFNYRSTIQLVEKGFYDFWNWFDYETWYPLGRIVGFTIYPGIMWTSASIYWLLQRLTWSVSLRDVCVLTAPFFASNTAMVAYWFGCEVKDRATGLVAAALIAVVPGYISRSVAGSFDNEGVAIFALLLTFVLFVKAVKTGSLAWSTAAALAYFYMVTAWGGYIFIINLLPAYVLVMLAAGRYSPRLYVAYNTVYILGMLLAMNIRFVGFNHIQSGEHLAALAVFGLLQLVAAVQWVKSQLPAPGMFAAFLRWALTIVGGLAALALGAGFATGYISPWTGRFYSLLDPTYAKAHIPIIASVSEHQPTTWSAFMFDLHFLMFAVPVGIYFCFRKLSDANIFLLMYTVVAVYFAGVMVRLILVVAPAACLMSAVALSSLLRSYALQAREPPGPGSGVGVMSPATLGGKAGKSGAKEGDRVPYQRVIAFGVLAAFTFMFVFYARHSAWVTSEAYSSPSIVLAAKQSDGGRIIFDDFREAYSWLKFNTPTDAKVMSWWDYGYQITAMGNRTILVDNNTWNNTHIATVGRAMASPEKDAVHIMRALDVDYVLVVFGGLVGYSSDDVNKFLWMVRIGGGVFPQIVEADYLAPNGDYRIDGNAGPAMLDSLLYKLSYYRFSEVKTDHNSPEGFDRVRNVEIGRKDFDLEYMEEAFTSQNWIVRLYKLKQPNNLGGPLPY